MKRSLMLTAAAAIVLFISGSAIAAPKNVHSNSPKPITITVTQTPIHTAHTVAPTNLIVKTAPNFYFHNRYPCGCTWYGCYPPICFYLDGFNYWYDPCTGLIFLY